VVRFRPVCEIDLGDQARLQPSVRLHRRCRERLAAPGVLRLRKIGKWTPVRFEAFEFGRDFPPQLGGEAVPHLPDEHKLGAKADERPMWSSRGS